MSKVDELLRQAMELTKHNCEALQTRIGEQDAELERLRRALVAAVKIKDATPDPTLLLEIREYADSEGVEVGQWVMEQLRITVDLYSGRVGLIPIDIEMYNKFRSLAKGRSQELNMVTASKAMTDLLRSGFDNYQL